MAYFYRTLNLRPEIQAIREAVDRYASRKIVDTWVPGETYLPATGKSVDGGDLWAMVRACLDLGLTAGPYATELESALARRCGVTQGLLVNSGSSALLLSLAALFDSQSEESGKKPLRMGDEILTSALAFPTSVNPIVQLGCIPVFVDIASETLNPTLETLEAARTPQTRAVVLAHTLGNPFAAAEIRDWCAEHSLFLIEDACDALGARYRGEPVGSFGDFATLSFYPSHQITTGEGGALLTKSSQLSRIAETLRDWGRDCWCAPGKDATCGRRFGWDFEGMPPGYDHKYIYSRLGYNLKATDLQAALGLSQMGKLENFVSRRRANWRRLKEGIEADSTLAERFRFQTPTPDSEPCWFGFVLRCAPGIDRRAIVKKLEEMKVGTRPLLAGNLTRQPAYRHVNLRVPAPLVETDRVLEDAFWIGVHPAIPDEATSYMVDCLRRAAMTQ